MVMLLTLICGFLPALNVVGEKEGDLFFILAGRHVLENIQRVLLGVEPVSYTHLTFLLMSFAYHYDMILIKGENSNVSGFSLSMPLLTAIKRTLFRLDVYKRQGQHPLVAQGMG